MQPPPNDQPVNPGNNPLPPGPPNPFPPQPAAQPYPPQGYPPPGYPPQGYAPQGYPPPPGPYGYPPPARRGFPWWGFLLAGCGCLVLFVPILAAILFPVFSQARESARAASCLSNQKQMATGILMYTQDYDEKMPGKNEWMTVIEPYLANKNSESGSPFPQLHCPTASMRHDDIYGYAYFSGLDRMEMSKIGSPRTTLMTFDSSTLTKNASDAASSLPVPPRHRKANLASFADGHASRIGATSGSYSGGD